MKVPSSSTDFDQAYRAPLTFWGDVRVPPEIKALARHAAGKRSLELGCGIGRNTCYMAQQGLSATGVDFSPVAIAKAQRRAHQAGLAAAFLVADVTQLSALRGPFDMSFDIGCFHCLDAEAQLRYAAEVGRLLQPGATHLIWALDETPSELRLTAAQVAATFAPHFELISAKRSRRRLARSHWYALKASAHTPRS